MLRVVSLILESRNVDGFITSKSVVRSMFETTNTHRTPVVEGDILIVIFKINCETKSRVSVKTV